MRIGLVGHSRGGQLFHAPYIRGGGPGGGLLRDLGTHITDRALRLFGPESRRAVPGHAVPDDWGVLSNAAGARPSLHLSGHSLDRI